MQKEQKQSTLQSVIHISIFAIVGGTIGFVSGIIKDPNLGEFVFLTTISGLLDGIYLGWFYQSNTTDPNTIVRLCIGIVTGIFLGMFLGSFLGGMLGTIVSFLFPSPFFTPIFLVGTVAGMIFLGIRIPMIIVNALGIKNPKQSPKT